MGRPGGGGGGQALQPLYGVTFGHANRFCPPSAALHRFVPAETLLELASRSLANCQ